MEKTLTRKHMTLRGSSVFMLCKGFFLFCVSNT